MMVTMISTLPPAWIMLIGAGLVCLMGNANKKWQHGIMLLLPLLTLIQLWHVSDLHSHLTITLASFNLVVLYIHPYTKIFGTIFSLAAFAGILFAYKQATRMELIAALVYAACAIGVTCSGDLISLFIYWEIMALASTIIIVCSRRPKAPGAALRYAYMHIFGGVLLMAGIVGYVALHQSAAIADFVPMLPDVKEDFFGQLTQSSYAVTLLILLGLLINAAAVPFSAWLPDAYPEGSPSGSVFLSAFTTKTAVFVLLTLFAGTKGLVVIGCVMIFYGIIMAILENDMRRILSYSIINQVGFMVTGIGIGTPLALHGVATHAFCHIIYKALLFMSAGSVLYMTGKSKCHELGGLYRSMPLTTLCGTIGALAISAFPLTSGFVSKSLVTSAAANEHMMITWFLLAAASAGVFLHAGIKFPWFVFFQKDSGLRPKDPPYNMRLAMILLSVLCIIPAIPGFTQPLLYSLLPEEETFKAYSAGHVVSQLQLLLFSGLAFFVMLPMLKRTNTITLDVDWVYRVLFKRIVTGMFFGINVIVMLMKLLKIKLDAFLQREYQLSLTSRYAVYGKSIGSTALSIVVMLGIYLVVYYVR